MDLVGELTAVRAFPYNASMVVRAMAHEERRHRFLISRRLQFRYMVFILIALLAVTSLVITSLYFGIWGSVLSAFSDEQIRNDLITASRIHDYEQARRPRALTDIASSLALFKETELLSQRQREVFHNILQRTNRELIWKLVLLVLLIAVGTIFISHKIAGPLYRLHQSLRELQTGNLSVRARLRRFDEAKAVAEQFNETATALEQRVEAMKRILKETQDPATLRSQLQHELDQFHTTSSRPS